ncbi:MAG: MotA/TolQ/ExbB proton channel family protein [Alphaproteobacteria bacterium]|jgi:biopolymer transport protein ExbB|nr:MotA/TolQ/ExbB proton channel family protein [Alphaproteobacteria bacterium]|tara:strand:+ start:2421 stop:3740 length:1320 start_codon:yes stop_codon:yes gene_type:complete
MKYKLLPFLLLSLITIGQDEVPEEIPIEEQRNNKIKVLLDVVKENKSIYVQKDRVRVKTFIELVDEREAMLAKAKKDLANEKIRNKNLETKFEANEKRLAELEESLQIKIGVLGELFGVTRQFAGELLASTEKAVTFSEFPQRPEVLRDIGGTQVHNLEQLQNLWISYLDEIVSSGEVKTINANIIDKNGESNVGEIVRYGHFTTSYDNKFVTPIPELNGFELLQRQPERGVLKNLKKHQKSDDFAITSIDPTRGFLLSLYIDKPGWLDRIAQGKSIGFIIILIGISGFLFSVYKIYTLREQERVIVSDNASVILEMEDIVKDVTNYESKENTLDEFIINYTGKLEWGANWVKFFAAVAPLLGLLGTVIGMIETFQAITLFGTGDPKQMAGGISQALVTTMLGLIVAAPLLGLYTYISQKVSNLSQVLEEKASYLLAKN